MVEEDDKGKAATLKDLEQNLAKELDSTQKSVQPQGPKPAGLANQAPPPPMQPKPREHVPTPAGLDEIDNMLMAQDPNLAKELGEIHGDLKGVAAEVKLESLGLPENFTEEEAEEKPDVLELESLLETHPPTKKKESFVAELPISAVRSAVATVTLPVRFFTRAGPLLKKIKSQPPKQTVQELGKVFGEEFAATRQKFAELFAAAKRIPVIVYIKTVVMVALLVGSFYVVKWALKSSQTAEVLDVELLSYEKVADKVIELTDDQGEAAEALTQPEYVVQIARIVANLRTDNSPRMSMVAVELYLEASNHEAAIEMKNREQEVRDMISRVLETRRFEDVNTTEGKSKLKVHIRSGVNKILTRGRVKRVFYKSLNIQK